MDSKSPPPYTPPKPSNPVRPYNSIHRIRRPSSTTTATVPHSRPAYSGTSRGLVVALDFGTTYSGVAYAVLEPGEVAKIRSLTCYKGMEDQSSRSKVPSVLFYDRLGNVRARGAEVYDPETSFQAQDEDWIPVEWFKLLFRPDDQPLTDAPEPQLPPGKTAVDVLADYLQYLQHAARDYIKETHPDFRKDLWDEVEDEIIYVLSHPNGWDGSQQTQMRNAAIKGGLIPPTDVGRARIRFVSEGEASFHWCVDNGLASSGLRVGDNIVVADAGGGTIDVSSFRVKAVRPFQIEETKPAESRLAGSVFVNIAFWNHVKDLLAGTKFDSTEVLDRLSEEFESKTKPLFRATSRKSFIPFGNRSDHMPSVNIQSGQLILSDVVMRSFFEPSCRAIAEAVLAQLQPDQSTIVFIVGGFAASPWLYSEVQNRLLSQNVVVKRADDHVAKAVAEGAVGFYLDHYVAARVAKFTYGVYSSPLYDPKNIQHVLRKNITEKTCAGKTYIKGGFSKHLTRGTVVQETSVHRIKFHDDVSKASSYECKTTLIRYRGAKDDIRWRDEDPDNFRKLCKFKATLPPSCCERKVGPNGLEYFQVDYWAVLTFGTTEFTCHIEWNEGGEVKRGPATLVWDEG